MGRYGSIDYSSTVKRGLLLGLVLMAVGETGGYLAENYVSVPGWEESLFLATAAVGLLAFVLSPIVFGIVLPLTE
ncbi:MULTISPECIES: DUF7860 family protein [Halolamina]|uniref:Major facilitator superfamily (MFS) profile domain-containing protein n=1 Tax=Halolamina pelagica TaxID=699431 RepID=A0A1I5QDR7_9EURY|nr:MULTISPECIES: hypothetical protein [Halolamina]NHX35210.1 hypothetical protein [Halolamina sp. R1-12]SFP44181.1 hypothetical protein SAMN05216277_103371 [Halolamina pelagica]